MKTLKEAIANEDLELVKILIAEEKEILSRDTPLTKACISNNIEIFEFIVKQHGITIKDYLDALYASIKMERTAYVLRIIEQYKKIKLFTEEQKMVLNEYLIPLGYKIE